jgi:hypothetical protein
MPITYTPIATNTLGTAVATVTFSSISQDYTDLVLVADITNATGADSLNLRFNGDTASNYSGTRIQGDSGLAESFRSSNATSMNIGYSTNVLTTNILSIMNYANTTTFKTVLGRSGAAGSQVAAKVGLWRKTPEAITSITVITSSGYNFAIGSTFTLYGILAA